MSVKAPPIKLQGIKTKLIPILQRHIDWSELGRWIEPFLGSGAVLFNLAPKRALVADSNEHLIRFYRAIQSGEITPGAVREFLESEGATLSASGGASYYEVRARFNQNKSPLDFLFLNRACFNGVIRFNRKGCFNVPFCKKPDRFAPAYITKIVNQVAWVTQLLKARDWEFQVADWRDTLAAAAPGDFVYCDPPYNDRHTDYFTRWTSQDADDLAHELKRLPTGFAYSTWKQNRYRTNEHLERHFAGFPVVTIEHFYHVGPTESLRNAMEEALVIAPGFSREGATASKVGPISQASFFE